MNKQLNDYCVMTRDMQAGSWRRKKTLFDCCSTSFSIHNSLITLIFSQTNYVLHHIKIKLCRVYQKRLQLENIRLNTFNTRTFNTLWYFIHNIIYVGVRVSVTERYFINGGLRPKINRSDIFFVDIYFVSILAEK